MVKAELERFARDQAFVVHISLRNSLCRVLGKYKLYVDPFDTSIAPSLMMDGIWESWITMALTGIVRKGMNVVNVGANVGYYAMLLADMVGSGGKVLAFEPQKRLAELIRMSAHANGFYGHRVDVRAFAVGDKNRIGLKMRLNSTRNGYAFICDELELKHVVQDGEEVLVDQVSLDAECVSADEKVDLVVMDCEGSEERVWDGMQHLLDRNPQMQLVLEFTPMFFSAPRLFAKKLMGRGHSMFEICEDGTLAEIAIDELCQRYQTNIALLK